MDMQNCPKCGRLFAKMASKICPICEKEEEAIFEKVKAYLDENPGCTMSELLEATGVSAKRVLRYLREGRLVVSKGMENVLVCESCGAPIITGRFCDKCIVKLNNDALELLPKKIKKPTGPVSSDAKMHLRKFQQKPQ